MAKNICWLLRGELTPVIAYGPIPTDLSKHEGREQGSVHNSSTIVNTTAQETNMNELPWKFASQKLRTGPVPYVCHCCIVSIHLLRLTMKH
jgi:hypothetical protein